MSDNGMLSFSMNMTRTAFFVVVLLATFDARAGSPPFVYDIQLQVRAEIGGTAFNLPNGSTFNSVTPNLNDAGNVAVKVNTIALTTSPGLWFGGHGVGGIVYNANDNDAILSDPFVNQNDQVSFPRLASSSATDDGLYLYENISGVTTHFVSGLLGITSFGNPKINDHGVVGMRAKFNTPQALGAYNIVTHVFTNYVTETTGDPTSRYSFLYAPASNNNDRIAAEANIDQQPSTYKELRIWNADGSSTLVASGDSNTGPVFFAMDNSISMNNLDQVAFITRTSTSSTTRRIVVGDGTTTTLFPTVSDGAGFTGIDFFAPSINDAGLVAFRGNDNQATPRDSVFVTNGATFQRIAGVNDPLMTDLGPRVVGFLMGGVSINNFGEVAFGVQFSAASGGGNAIYVAYRTDLPTPTPTPTASPKPTVTPSVTPTATPPISPTPTPGATVTPTVSPSATPSVTPTVTPTAAPTPTATPVPPARTINLSTRMRVLTGDKVGVGGFILSGAPSTGSAHRDDSGPSGASKEVLIRAIGPSLGQFGVPNVLPDPVLELHGPDGFATITNDNWRDDPVQAARIKATGLAPTNDLEAAIAVSLSPAAYTAIIRGNTATSGAALIEVYDLSQTVPAKLANISTRAFVDTADDIVIAGFILGNQGGEDRIVARGIGPSLMQFGVNDALTNPVLELRDTNGSVLVANDDWQDDSVQAAELMAVGLAPSDPSESGIAGVLSPGAYTALLSGLNNGTGVGVVEVYDLGAP